MMVSDLFPESEWGSTSIHTFLFLVVSVGGFRLWSQLAVPTGECLVLPPLLAAPFLALFLSCSFIKDPPCSDQRTDWDRSGQRAPRRQLGGSVQSPGFPCSLARWQILQPLSGWNEDGHESAYESQHAVPNKGGFLHIPRS
jgi:hypothetical protein